ncbi:hypothetical protein H5410_021994 [Solanum commersonii]|uniref:Uncharacterized protein n=1 Tax=Solanum commersonii TaxID=4109 RepID=A0A9J5ZCX6_SOLCO|nr:hypothetical protein H5410_021994 [Solanum commersonii]
MCIPKEEGRLGFRSLHIVNMFYLQNYGEISGHPHHYGAITWATSTAKRHIPQFQGVLARRIFWFDNWTKQVALYYTEGESARDEEIKVKQFIEEGSWNKRKLRDCLSE